MASSNPISDKQATKTGEMKDSSMKPEKGTFDPKEHNLTQEQTQFKGDMDLNKMNINQEENKQDKDLGKQEDTEQVKEFQGRRQDILGQQENKDQNVSSDLNKNVETSKDQAKQEMPSSETMAVAKTDYTQVEEPKHQKLDPELIEEIKQNKEKGEIDFIRKGNEENIGKEEKLDFNEDIDKPIEQRHLGRQDYWKDVREEKAGLTERSKAQEPLIGATEKDYEGMYQKFGQEVGGAQDFRQDFRQDKQKVENKDVTQEEPSLKKRDDNIVSKEIPQDVKTKPEEKENVQQSNVQQGFNPSSVPYSHKYDLDKPEVKEVMGSDFTQTENVKEKKKDNQETQPKDQKIIDKSEKIDTEEKGILKDQPQEKGQQHEFKKNADDILS